MQASRVRGSTGPVKQVANRPAPADFLLVGPRTHEAREQRVAVAAAGLIRRSPSLFAAKQIRPLAIGIHKQLLPHVDAGTRCVTRKALTRFCNTRAYLEAVAAGVHRVNLDGTDAGPPTEAHRQRARVMLAASA